MKEARWLLRLAAAAALLLASVTAGTLATGLLGQASKPTAVTLPGSWTDYRSFANGDQFMDHSAVLLSGGKCAPDCGKVLVVGGGGDSAQLFDPTNGTWSETASPLPEARQMADAVYLPALGKVLVTGGLSPCELTSYGYDQCQLNGQPDLPPTPVTYDISAGTWTATKAMNFPHFAARAVVVGDPLCALSCKVLVIGGLAPPVQTSAPPQERETHWPDPTGIAEVYDPLDNAWHIVGGQRFSHSAGSTATRMGSGKVLITEISVASRDPASPNIMGDEIYDPTTGTFTLAAQSSTHHDYGGAVLLPTGMVLVFGGGSHTITEATMGAAAVQGESELYDPTSDTWTGTGREANPRDSGDGGNYGINYAGDRPSARMPVALLSDGRVLVSGDTNGNTVGDQSTEIYDSSLGRWAPSGQMNHERFSHSLTTLEDGRVLAAGGGVTGGFTPSQNNPAEAWSESQVDPLGAVATPTSTPTPSDSPTPTPSNSPTPTPSGTPTPTPSDSPTPTPSGSPTPTPSGSPTPTPSGSPTPTPSTTPTPSPLPIASEGSVPSGATPPTAASSATPHSGLNSGTTPRSSPGVNVSVAHRIVGARTEAFPPTVLRSSSAVDVPPAPAGAGASSSRRPQVVTPQILPQVPGDGGPAVRAVRYDLTADAAPTEPPGGRLAIVSLVALLVGLAVVGRRLRWL